MSLYNVIIKPIVTEKTATMEVAGSNRTYTLEIAPEATKVDVKNAFKAIYGVDVESVNVTSVREKFRNTRKGLGFRRRPSKKAYVTLKK
jgi:large subunit ribosomal protein L23